MTDECIKCGRIFDISENTCGDCLEALEAAEPTELAQDRVEIERLRGELSGIRMACTAWETVYNEAQEEIARLRSPLEVWKAYHALGDKVLCPWKEHHEWLLERYTVAGTVIGQVHHSVEWKAFCAGLKKRFTTKEEAIAWVDATAAAHGYTLIDSA